MARRPPGPPIISPSTALSRSSGSAGHWQATAEATHHHHLKGWLRPAPLLGCHLFSLFLLVHAHLPLVHVHLPLGHLVVNLNDARRRARTAPSARRTGALTRSSWVTPRWTRSRRSSGRQRRPCRRCRRRRSSRPSMAPPAASRPRATVDALTKQLQQTTTPMPAPLPPPQLPPVNGPGFAPADRPSRTLEEFALAVQL